MYKIIFAVLLLTGCVTHQDMQTELDKKAFLLKCGEQYCVGGYIENTWYLTELKKVAR